MVYYLIPFILSLIFWGWFIRRYDKFEPEPLISMLIVGLVGGLISSLVAGILNFLMNHILGAGLLSSENLLEPSKAMIMSLFIGFNEETCKAMATFFLIRNHRQFTEPVDALIYAMSVALGFALIENVMYMEKYGLVTFIVRQFNAVPLHIGLAAWWAVGIARAKYTGPNQFKTVLPYLLIPSLLHAFYDFFLFISGNPGLNLLLSAAIAAFAMVMAHKKLKQVLKKDDKRKEVVCPNCFIPVSDFNGFCPGCGTNLGILYPIRCPGCLDRNPEDAVFCIHCGKKLIP